ncbi:MAG TPA: OsmC family protein [Vicinamibacteria bacterium]|nr:OsmC family protein [Vicinamibacteria bacterium]
MTATAERVAPRASKAIEPFPHHYELKVTGTGDGQGRISAGARPDIVGGPPAQFGGRDDWWSPEHLLLGAVSLCLLTTFRALADARGVEVMDYSSQVKGILDRTSEGPAFTSIVLDVELKVPEGQKERAAELLERAKRICIVSHALRPPVDLRTTVAAG